MAPPTEDGPSGIWGLIIEPGKRYAKMVDVPFHITAAVLDTMSTGDSKDDVVSVMLEVDGMELIICNLSLDEGILQCPLNLKFEEGSRIAFYSTGSTSNVHLTGNVIGNKEKYTATEMKSTGKFTQKRRNVDENAGGSAKKTKANADKANNLAQLLDEDIEDEEDDDDYEDTEDSGEEEESDIDEEMEAEEEGEEEAEEEEEEDEEIVTKMDDSVSKSPPKSDENKQNNVAAEETVNGTPNKKKKKKKNKNKDVEQTPIKQEKSENGEKSPKTPKSQKKAQNAPADIQKSPKSQNATPGKAPSSPKSPKIVKAGGVTCEDLVVGTGTEAKLGKNVGVFYEGRLTKNNKMFDKCQGGKPFKFRLGTKDIIPGWNVAIAGMKVGGKRKFVCPPHLGYGKAGAPPDIPPNSSLTFTVELKSAN